MTNKPLARLQDLLELHLGILESMPNHKIQWLDPFVHNHSQQPLPAADLERKLYRKAGVITLGQSRTNEPPHTSRTFFTSWFLPQRASTD